MDQTKVCEDDEVILIGRNSAVVRGALLVKAEHSFDGVEYASFTMKHDTGAAMMGVPFGVLANPPTGIKLRRIPRHVISIGPGNAPISLSCSSVANSAFFSQTALARRAGRMRTIMCGSVASQPK